jgi:hypothetical protein
MDTSDPLTKSSPISFISMNITPPFPLRFLTDLFLVIPFDYQTRFWLTFTNGVSVEGALSATVT